MTVFIVNFVRRVLGLLSPEGRVRYTYIENASKNRTGGICQLDVSHKVVHQFEDPSLSECCHVFLLTKLPKSAKEQDVFYLRPLSKISDVDDAVWFSSVLIGKYVLSKMVKKMCSKAKKEGNKTNHSLRATGITSLFQAGLPEKAMQDRSGHRSLDGLRKYERI